MSDHHDSHGSHELSFWRKYIFSTDHKIIGLQYGITALIFLFFGFCLMMLMRWQLAYPGEPIPYINNAWLGLGKIIDWIRLTALNIPGSNFAEETLPGGVMLPEFYNQLGAMHGTIMVFMGIVPLAVGAFGNYIVPLQIGAPDMTFPRINMVIYYAFLVGGIVMLVSFFLPGGAASSGWTSYSPLANIAPIGQTFWIIGMVCLITSSLLGAVNFIATIFQLRCECMTFMRM